MKKWLLLLALTAVPALWAAAEKTAEAIPETLHHRGIDLYRTRQKMMEDPEYLKAERKHMVIVCNKMLDERIGTILDKPGTAPSGDKHDYYTWAIYYWPNPDTPDGKPYISKDGRENPERLKHTDEIPFMAMIRNVRTLAFAGYYTGDQRYSAKAAEYLRVWFVTPETRMNPNLTYSQVRPGKDEGRGYGAGIITVSFRIQNLLDSVTLLRGQPCWSAEDDAAFCKWLREYMNWLATSPLSDDAKNFTNNHSTYFAAQQAMLHLFFGEKEAAHDVIKDIFDKRFAIQFSASGSQPRELGRAIAFTYSTMNLRGWVSLAEMGKRCGFDGYSYKSSKGSGIYEALKFFVPFVDGKTEWKNKQIKGGIPYASVWELMVRGAQNYDDPDFEKAAMSIADKPRLRLEKFYFPYVK